MQEGKDLIQIKDLHKVFKIKGRDVIALEGINLTVKEGEIFGIIGLSGAGKSTFGLVASARAMATRCFCPPDSCTG